MQPGLGVGLLVLGVAAVWLTPAGALASQSTYTSAHFALHTDVSPKSAKWLLDALAATRPTHLDRLGLVGRPIPQISLTVFGSRKDFNTFARQRHPWMVGALGATTPEGVYVCFDRSRKACLGLLMHELTHAYLRACDIHVDVWLNEGLACYFGGVRVVAGSRFVFGVLDPDRVIAVARAVRSRRHVPLQIFVRLRKRQFYEGHHEGGAPSRQSRLIYGEAATLVHFLVRSKAEHMKDKFGRFLDLAYADSETCRAFESVYGPDYAAIERLWKPYVVRLIK